MRTILGTCFLIQLVTINFNLVYYKSTVYAQIVRNSGTQMVLNYSKHVSNSVHQVPLRIYGALNFWFFFQKIAQNSTDIYQYERELVQ